MQRCAASVQWLHERIALSRYAHVSTLNLQQHIFWKTIKKKGECSLYFILLLIWFSFLRQTRFIVVIFLIPKFQRFLFMYRLCIYICIVSLNNNVSDFHQFQLHAFEIMLQVPLGNFELDWLIFTADTFFSRALCDNQQVLILI